MIKDFEIKLLLKAKKNIFNKHIEIKITIKYILTTSKFVLINAIIMYNKLGIKIGMSGFFKTEQP